MKYLMLIIDCMVIIAQLYVTAGELGMIVEMCSNNILY